MAQSKGTTSRAEEVRRRRESRSRTSPATVSPGRGRKPANPVGPPVLVRGGFIGAPVQSRQRGKPPRRRFDVALGSTGAEMRLPSFPIIRFGWRLLSGALVAGLSFALYTLWTAPLYRVEAAQMEGLKRLAVEDINAVAGLAGESIFAIQPDEIHQGLQRAFPELASIAVEVGLPATVSIVVEERQPVLAWRQDERIVWVDAAGVAFPPRGEPAPSILVEAENSPALEAGAVNGGQDGITERFLPADLVSAVLAMSVEAPDSTPLVFTRDHGLGWRDSRGWQVFFGRLGTDMPMKLSVYEAITQHLAEVDIQPALISVEYLHAPYYRPEQ